MFNVTLAGNAKDKFSFISPIYFPFWVRTILYLESSFSIDKD